MHSAGIFGLGASVTIFLAITYFLPTTVAFIRGHHSKIAIAALNILLGWTFIGWVVAFVWSLTAKRPRD